MAAAIAAFRAGNAPHILQVFEVGTGTMMSAKGAIKPVEEVMTEAGEKFDQVVHRRGRGLLHESQGRDALVPFQQLDDGLLLQQGRVREGGPRSEPCARDVAGSDGGRREDQGVGRVAVRLHDGMAVLGARREFPAWHNVPIASKENGMGGLDTTFQINSPLHVRHWTNLKEWNSKGTSRTPAAATRPRRSSTAANARC